MTEPKEGIATKEQGEPSVAEKDTRSVEDRSAGLQMILSMSRDARKALPFDDLRREQRRILNESLSEQASIEAGKPIKVVDDLTHERSAATLSTDTLQRFRDQWRNQVQAAQKEGAKLQAKEGTFSAEEGADEEAKKMMAERDLLLNHWQLAESAAAKEVKIIERALELKQNQERDEAVGKVRSKIDAM